jgi:diacylglycerol kinase family enzyme
VDGVDHHVDSSSIIATSTEASTSTVFFLRDSELFFINGEQLNEAFPGYDVSLDTNNTEGHIVVSVLSGKCQAESFFDGVIAPLLDQFNVSNHYQVHKTTSTSSVIELSRNILLPAARAGRKQRILLLSGDGGIVDVINELLSVEDQSDAYTPPVVSLIPMGTGNALAHSTKIFDATNGLASWLRGQPRDLPLFRVTFSHDREGAKLLADEGRKKENLAQCTSDDSYFWGAVVFSWGFHAQIVADSDTPEFRKHGAKRFQMAAQEALFRSDSSGPHHYRGSVKVQQQGGDKTISWAKLGNDEHCYVLGTLVSNLEETFTVSPGSTPLNGTIRLVHIGPESGEEIMRIMGLAYQQGKHVDDKKVDYVEVDGFSVRFEEEEEKWRRVCVDGKIILVEKGGSVEVQREKRVAIQITTLS